MALDTHCADLPDNLRQSATLITDDGRTLKPELEIDSPSLCFGPSESAAIASHDRVHGLHSCQRKMRGANSPGWAILSSIVAGRRRRHIKCQHIFTGVDERPRPFQPDLDVLALNSGSSSLKFGLYRVGSSRTAMLLSGAAESIGDSKGRFFAHDARQKEVLSVTAFMPGQREAIARIGRLLAESAMPAPAAIGHRIVHGGPKLRAHRLIDDSVLRLLEAAVAFAPLHTPAALSVIRCTQEHFPGIA